MTKPSYNRPQILSGCSPSPRNLTQPISTSPHKAINSVSSARGSPSSTVENWPTLPSNLINRPAIMLGAIVSMYFSMSVRVSGTATAVPVAFAGARTLAAFLAAASAFCCSRICAVVRVFLESTGLFMAYSFSARGGFRHDSHARTLPWGLNYFDLGDWLIVRGGCLGYYCLALSLVLSGFHCRAAVEYDLAGLLDGDVAAIVRSTASARSLPRGEV